MIKQSTNIRLKNAFVKAITSNTPIGSDIRFIKNGDEWECCILKNKGTVEKPKHEIIRMIEDLPILKPLKSYSLK